MENITNSHIISCPHCGKKYFPSEIFVPKNFLGTAFYITDEIYVGSDMDLQERYTCDACNNTFCVEAHVSFKSYESKIKNFDELEMFVDKDSIILKKSIGLEMYKEKLERLLLFIKK